MSRTRFLHGLRRLAWPLLAAVVLFAVFSQVRNLLVPADADFDRARWRLTGDEPAYLLTAQAIASGDGEDVSRVHAAHTWTNFYARPVIGDRQWTWKDYRGLGCPFWIDRSEAWGKSRQVIQRPPLIAAFAAPFALRPRGARRAVLCAHALFAVLVAFLFCACAVRSGASGPWAAWTVVCFFGSLPIVYYTAEIFPEVLVGGMDALALLLCRSRRPAVRSAAAALLIVSLWGTGRVVPAVAVVSLLLAWRELRARNITAVAAYVAGWIVYLAYNLNLWGYPVPPTPPNGGTLTFGALRLGLLADFFGNDVGLFFLCPVAVVGAWSLAILLLKHRDDPSAWPCLLYSCALAAVVASFSNPRAGTCPAGRYQVAQAFALAVPPLVLLARAPSASACGRRLRGLLVVLGGSSLAMGILVGVQPSWWFQRYHPLFKAKRLNPHYAVLPDFQGRWIVPLLLWTLFFAALTLPWERLFRRIRAKREDDGTKRG